MRVLLAPVGAGKTQAALEAISRAVSRAPLARIWVLLPTRRQEDAFRQRLIDYDDGRSLYFNIEFFNFYGLNRRLLDMAAVAAHELTDAARYRLLRTVIDAERDALTAFGGIAATPGFARITGDLIYELKQNLITPEAFSAAARTPKDHDLARLYDAYQRRLIRRPGDQQFVDREGAGWLALAQLEADPALASDLALLVADGFDQFSPVQARLLALLSARAQETLITLTTVPEREQTVGRRFTDTLALLERETTVQVEPRSQSGAFHRASIQHLTARIFRENAASDRAAISDDGLRFVEAPDAAGEVAAILRDVKRLLLNGTAPESIMVALRDWERYAPHFRWLGRAYGLPLALHHGEPLAANPCIAALFDALALAAAGWPRRALIDALKSPYLRIPGIDARAANLLDRISQDYQVVAGRDQWRDALIAAARPDGDADPDDDPRARLPRAEADALRAALEAFCDALTPPEAMHAVDTHIAWIEALIGPDPHYPTGPYGLRQAAPAYTLDVIGAARGTGEAGVEAADDLIARDIHALHEFKLLLRGLRSAYALPGDDARVPWDTFFTDMTRSAAATPDQRDAGRAGRVLVTTATDARGLPHDYVYLPGLSEGVFPAPIREDPLYLDSERAALSERGIPLRPLAERAADDGLFFELISLPRVRLTLTRPTIDGGDPWPESHLWRAALDAFDGVLPERIRAGEVVLPEGCASLAEAALAAAVYPAQAGALAAWLDADQPDLSARIRHSARIETSRLSYGARYDRYAGRIEDVDLRERLRAAISARPWSPTRLNDYALSPFRYFANHLLNLEALEEPEAGMDALQRGLVVHELLEIVYGALHDSGLPLTPDALPDALAALDAHKDALFAAAPRRYGFRASALWRQEQDALERQIRALLTADLGGNLFGADGSRRVYAIEYRLPPTPISIDGRAVSVHGRIDRIDRTDAGLVLVDYKTNKADYTRKMRQMIEFQMLVYMRALAQQTGLPVISGAFVSVPGATVSGELRADDAELLDTLSAQLGRNLDAVLDAHFFPHAAQPSDGKCIHYCDFQHLCRLCLTPKRQDVPSA